MSFVPFNFVMLQCMPALALLRILGYAFEAKGGLGFKLVRLIDWTIYESASRPEMEGQLLRVGIRFLLPLCCRRGGNTWTSGRSLQRDYFVTPKPSPRVGAECRHLITPGQAE